MQWTKSQVCLMDSYLKIMLVEEKKTKIIHVPNHFQNVKMKVTATISIDWVCSNLEQNECEIF